jgi:hypothetical protein
VDGIEMLSGPRPLADLRDRIILGDCLDVLRTLPEATVDAVITDPPYCAGAISEAQRTRAHGQGLRSENLRRFGWFVGDNMSTAGFGLVAARRGCRSPAHLQAVGIAARVLRLADARLGPTRHRIGGPALSESRRVGQGSDGARPGLPVPARANAAWQGH